MSAKISRDLREQMKAQTIAFTQLLSRMESLNHNRHRTARREIYQAISVSVDDPFEAYNADAIRGITADIEMLDVSDDAEQKVREAVHKDILQSLRYPTMSNRYEDVLEAHPETFEWAFEPSPGNSRHEWSNLAQWLEGNEGIYWISGKAGSGKSTLMKHMYDDARTHERLKIWAKHDPLCISTFFFWNSGTKEQKSNCGLLRALLYQIISKYPDLSPIVLPALWAHLYSKAISPSSKSEEPMDSWSIRQLMTAFTTLIRQKSIPIKLFFLIDGLDEFEGDHEELARLFQDISSHQNVKVCLSSRPWVVFEHIFDGCPSLRLQHLTYPDIEHYVQDKLMGNSFFQRLERNEPDRAPALVQEIVDKADGVFLWVKLVVNSLLNGIRNNDEMSHLWERLRLLPRELEPLYQRLLDLIEPLYWLWVSKTFQLLRNNRDLGEFPFGSTSSGVRGVEGLTVASFYLAMEPDIDDATILRMSSHQLKDRLEKMCIDKVLHLTARCAGLLEVSNIKGTDSTGADSQIVFFHRTARDFLYSDVHWSKLELATAKTDFNPNVAMMRSCILQALVYYCIHQRPKEEDKTTLEATSSRNNQLPQCAMDETTRAIAMNFIIYAYNANRHGLTATGQVKLLDQFDRILEFKWINSLYTSLRGFPNMFEVAALFDLRNYLCSKFQQFTEEKSQEMATDVLRYLLPERDCHVKFGIPLPSLEMVSFLLRLGADPNERGRSLSPWENTLRFSMEATQQLHPPKTESERTFDQAFELPAIDLPTLEMAYDARPLQLRYIEIMTVLVEAGADPAFYVSMHRGHDPYSALDLTEGFLANNFPVDAAPLLKLLQEKLNPQKSHAGHQKSKRKRRKRERSVDSDSAKVVRSPKRRGVKKNIG